MKDVLQHIEKAYVTALKLTGEKTYNGQVPDEIKGNYIVFGGFDITEKQINTPTYLTVTSRVTIYSEADQYNSGEAVNTIAGKVYEQLYDNNAHNLALPTGFNMVSTELASDRKSDWRLKNQLVSIDRVISFRHVIFVQ